MRKEENRQVGRREEKEKVREFTPHFVRPSNRRLIEGKREGKPTSDEKLKAL